MNGGANQRMTAIHLFTSDVQQVFRIYHFQTVKQEDRLEHLKPEYWLIES